MQTLAIVSTVMQVVGAFSSAGAAMQQGAQAKTMGEFNAKIARNNAAMALAQAQADADAKKREAQQQLGAMRAGYGASGVSVEGSPLDALEMSASNAELDRQNILYRGRVRALGFETEAQLAEMRGENEASVQYGKAGSALFTGLAQAGSKASGFFGGKVAAKTPAGGAGPGDDYRF